MIIGSHVSFKDGLLGSVKEAISYDATTFMFYTGAPQNTQRKPLDLDNAKEAYKLMNENSIDIKNVICHAPYIINLANKNELSKWKFSIDFLKNEIKRCEQLNVSYIVLHPGSAVMHTHEDALVNISDALNEVLSEDVNVNILLETMAGKGSECGNNIDDLAYIISHVIYNKKLGVCIDTCHLNDSGINLAYFDEYLCEFDKKIGISKIKCVHINDSLNPLGSKKDRHANIGYGTIGFENLINVVYHESLKNVPKILETPYVGDFPPYKEEIKEIREKEFNPNLKESLEKYYRNL